MHFEIISIFNRSVFLSTAGISGVAAYFLPNTIFLDKLQYFTQFMSNGSPVPISAELCRIREDVMNDMKFTPEEKEKIELYSGWNFNFFYAGSIWRHKIFGGFDKAIIGVPFYFNFENSFDSKIAADMVIQRDPINWNSKWAEMFKNSCLLSEKAKKFGIAQNLYYISQCEPLVKGCYSAMITIVTISLIRYVMGLKKLQKFKVFRYCSYAFIVFSNITFWTICKDNYRCYLEQKADETLAALGKDYAEGGLEFYESFLERNIAVNGLLEEKGKKPNFTKFGNEHSLLTQKSIQLTTRRDNFKNLLD